MPKTRQLRAVHSTKVFHEVASGAKTDRPAPDMVRDVVKKRRSLSSIRDAGGDFHRQVNPCPPQDHARPVRLGGQAQEGQLLPRPVPSAQRPARAAEGNLRRRRRTADGDLTCSRTAPRTTTSAPTTSSAALPSSGSSSRSRASPSSVTRSSSNPFPRLPNV